MSISQRQRSRLVEILQACESLIDQETRKVVLEDLRQEIRGNIKRSSIESVDINNIVSGCLSYYGGLENLILALYRFEKGKLFMDQVWENLPVLYDFGQLLSLNYYSKLLPSIVQIELPKEKVKEFYEQVRPDHYTDRYTATGLIETLSALSKMPPGQPDQPLPLLQFIFLLSEQISDEVISMQLKEWLTSVSPEHPVFTITQKSGGEKSLLVKISPDLNNPNQSKQKKYFVSIFLWSQDRKTPACWHEETNACSLGNIPQLISKILAEHAEIPDTIEIFLPHDLIDCTVEAWPYSSGFIPSELGIEFPIAIRSLDRAMSDNKQLYTKWCEKWYGLQDAAMTLDEIVLWVCDEDYYDDDQAFYLELRRQNKFCLGLTVKPAANLKKRDFFRAILQAGLPIALWPRPFKRLSSETADIQGEMMAAIEDKGIGNLPAILHKKRLEPTSDSEINLAKHMALLWDDPKKLPPTVLVYSMK
jgi:hypothetical protein